MSITPSAPQPNDLESPQYEAGSTPRWIFLAVAALSIALGGLLYLGYTSRSSLNGELAAANERSEVLSQQMQQTNERIAQLQGQLEVTSQKLGLTQSELARARTLAQEIKKDQLENDTKLGEQIGQVKQENQQSQEKLGQVATDLTGAKTDIAATRKDLEDTKSRLTTTVGDLGVQSGLIARNREDLEALRRLNERNIYDFNIVKAKNPQRVGPIQVLLKNADVKRYRYTMTVVADDKPVEKKDRNINEPVQFYVRGARSPYEIVVFEVTKNRITGYLSTPKETTSAAVPAASPARAQ
jgi:predicted  nucleic acid-binding Zn-ribbon protein